MKRTLSIVLALLLMGQAAPPEPSPKFEETVSVGYVMVPFTVIGEQGVPLTNLTAKDVKLFVDGAQVSSDLFERSMNAPVSFAILVDGSGSMGLAGKLDAARAALGTVFARRVKGDEFALYVFDDRQVHEVVPFTEDVYAIARAMDRIKPFGKTAFFDALATMPDRSELGKNPTRAILLLSDGIDNASRLSRRDLEQRLQGVAVPIYPLGLRPAADHKPLDAGKPDETLSDLGVLDQVATITGGKLFVGNEPRQLALAVDEIERNLRAQYLIGFAPTGRGAVKYRRISLLIDGKTQSVRVRAGYNGTEAPVAMVARTERKN